MAKFKPTVGVDISSTSVRLVRVDSISADGRAEVTAAAFMPLRDNAVDRGVIRSVPAVAAAIDNGLRKIRSRHLPVVFGANDIDAAVARVAVPREIPANRRISMLTTNNNRIASAIPTAEAELATCYVGDDVTQDGSEVASLIVAATKQSEVETLRAVAASSKVRLDRIDLSAAATFRSLIRDYRSSREVSAIVDVGASTTKVLIREGLHVRSLRAFPSGGADLTRALSAALKCSFDDAETRKYQMSLGRTSSPVHIGYGDSATAMDEEYIDALAGQTSAEAALNAAADHLVDQIAQSLSGSSSSGIRQIALCGGSLLLGGFKDRVQRRTGIEVRVGQPWAYMKKNKHTEPFFIEDDANPVYMLAFATAIGLAVGSGPARRGA